MSALPISGTLQLRPMRLDDLDAVLAVERSTYSFPWTRGNFIDSLASGYLAELLLDDSARLIGYFVAMVGVDEMHLLNLSAVSSMRGSPKAVRSRPKKRLRPLRNRARLVGS